MDLVELTTGEGPEVELEVKVDKNEVKEYGEVKVTGIVKNETDKLKLKKLILLMYIIYIEVMLHTIVRIMKDLLRNV